MIAPGPMVGTCLEYHRKAELKKACLAEAGRCFTQAHDTPLLTQPLIDHFWEYRWQKAVQDVLEGTFQPPPQCNVYAAKFLSATLRPLGVEDMATCSTQMYCCGWQKAQETTRSSASGIHFGHYMAGMFNPEMLLINTTLANIPFWTGFSYECWKKVINVMIEKM